MSIVLHVYQSNQSVATLRIRCMRFVLSFVCTTLLFGACADSLATSPLTPTEEVLHELIPTPGTLTMAQGDTVRITLVAKNILGDTLPIGPDDTVEWKSLDNEIVSIDAHGVVTALKPNTSFVYVTGTWKHGGVSKTATVEINVTETRYPVAHIELIPRDSARVGTAFSLVTFFSTHLEVRAVDSSGNFLMFPQVQFEGRDRDGNIIKNFTDISIWDEGSGQYAIIHSGTRRTLGKFWTVAYATMYGRTIRDSIELTGIYPFDVTIEFARDSITRTFSSLAQNQTVEVQPCAAIYFQNSSSVPIDIIFDKPNEARPCTDADTDGGNILGLRAGYDGMQYRRFPALGTRTWTVRDATTGAILPRLKGTIIMREPE